jgi:hypothetical protein
VVVHGHDLDVPLGRLPHAGRWAHGPHLVQGKHHLQFKSVDDSQVNQTWLNLQ